MKTKIYLIDAGTARGKTESYVRHIAKSSDRFVVATQQSDLSNSIQDRLISAGVPVTEIRVISGKTDANCNKSFKKALTSKQHRILIVDQSVAMRRYEAQNEFHLIIDEAPKIDKSIKVKATETFMQEAFASLFQDAIGYSSSYYEIVCTVPVAHAIQQIQKSYYKPDVDAPFHYSKQFVELTSLMRDPKLYRVLVHADDLRHWRDGTIDENDRARPKLVSTITFYPTLKPSSVGLYQSVTIACANATKMEFYDHWLPEAEFETSPLTDQLRKDISEVKADKIHIHYLSEKNGSWYALRNLEGGYQRFLSAFADAFNREFPGEELLYCMRKEQVGEPPYVFDVDGAVRLNSNARGVDHLKHLHFAAILSPLNPTTEEFKFKRDCHQMDSEAFRTARVAELNYQFASRLSMRDYERNDDNHVFVLDRKIALALQEIYKCADPIFFDIGIPELAEIPNDQPAKTGAERQHKYLESQKAIKNDLAATEQYDGFGVIKWARRGADKLVQRKVSWFDLINDMEADALGYVPKSKFATKVFREGRLTNGSHKLRGNIVSTKLLILDIDNALLPPQQLSDFLHKNGWSHFIYHSYSSTNSENHIRVVLGLDIPVNADNYTRIIKLLEADIIAKFGKISVGDKKVGIFEIDQSKMTINCSFHVPTVPQNGKMPFIKRTIMQDGRFEPKFLCVSEYLSRHQVVQPHMRHIVDTSKPQSKKREISVEEILMKHQVPPKSAVGSRKFFLAGQELLLSANCSFDEVARILTANISRFGTPENRSVDGVIQSLKRYYGARIALRDAA